MRPIYLVLIAVAVFAGALVAIYPQNEFHVPTEFPAPDADAEPADAGPQLATFGSGCFWCTEAVFQRVNGVQTVVSGYSGGHVVRPTYQQVCEETTGHAEVIHLTYDPAEVSYPELLEVFWRSHDPTTKDRQGDDRGPQYRSVIFYHSDRQRRLAEHYKRKIDEAHVYPAPVVTEITAFERFYRAEEYHQDYYAANANKGYCRSVIRPKLNKLKEVFAGRLKD
ncbi:MAG TPA: peptide-methionine (S)-S-oxide reductase MsrA [Gemmataceae bacterium]|nr:peptide-methionine (S)-S-oxide reductase MsrA [Gemmataceae bacterium]